MDTATQMSEKTIREQLQELDLRKKDLELREHLFNMKWGVLENEVRKLAVERQEFKAWRESEETRLRAMEEELAGISGGDGQTIICGTLFFCGIHNDENSLKRRYRDLLKIYHPDNPDGDNDTIQEINREYDRLHDKICG